MARILDSRDTDVRGVQKFVSAVLAEHDVALAFLRVFEHVDERSFQAKPAAGERARVAWQREAAAVGP
jgi:hypothetical protein